MANRSTSHGWLVRTSFLLAALAVMAAGALEPVVHAPSSDSNPTAASTGSRLPEGSDSGQHEEALCPVCQVLAGLAIPVTSTIPIEPARPTGSPPIRRGLASLSAPHSISQARAPPA